MQNSFYSGPASGPQVVVQPMNTNQYSDANSIKFRPGYFGEPSGILRVALTICQFAGLIAAASITKLFTILPDEYTITRDTYLGFAIVGFIISLVILILSMLNIINVGFARNVPWDLITLALDILWLIPMFILGIVCAVKEGNVKDQLFLSETYVNKGGFAAAAFFGFLTALLYAVDAGFNLVKLVRRMSDK